MKYRLLGKTNVKVSEVSLGTWQLGGKWGDSFDEKVAQKTLEQATIHGINCYDTADVYQGGKSELAIGSYIKTLDEKPFVITKIGRQMEQTVENYSEENIRKYIDECRKRLDVDTLDMVLLHCPPTDLYDQKKVFGLLDQLKEEQKIKHYQKNRHSSLVYPIPNMNIATIAEITNCFPIIFFIY